jgi:hypothetical protein
MNNLTFPLVVKLLKTLLPAILTQFNPGTSAYNLLQLAITLLGGFNVAHSHASNFRAELAADQNAGDDTFRVKAAGPQARQDLPPEEDWTVEGWLEWAEAHGGKVKNKKKIFAAAHDDDAEADADAEPPAS